MAFIPCMTVTPYVTVRPFVTVTPYVTAKPAVTMTSQEASGGQVSPCWLGGPVPDPGKSLAIARR